MDRLEEFYEIIKRDQTVVLATSSDGNVTMRMVSPVLYENKILIFTDASSTKFAQLKANPKCCIAAREFYVQATAEFMGKTALLKNAKLRKAYAEKFANAFVDGVSFGGMKADFILFTPHLITGWGYADDNAPEKGIMPFEIEL